MKLFSPLLGNFGNYISGNEPTRMMERERERETLLTHPPLIIQLRT